MCSGSCGGNKVDFDLFSGAFEQAKSLEWVKWERKWDALRIEWEGRCRVAEENQRAKGLELELPPMPEMPAFPSFEDVLGATNKFLAAFNGLSESKGSCGGSCRSGDAPAVVNTLDALSVAHNQV